MAQDTSRLGGIFPGRSWLLVTVAALGYFVDIYDLVLFNVVKRESLEFILGAGHPDIKVFVYPQFPARPQPGWR